MRTISLIVLIAVLYSGVKAQTKLKPQSDGYIFLSGEKMNSNHGTGDTLITRYTKRGSTTAYTYIRFDLLKQARHFKKATFNIYGSTDSTKLIDV